MADGHDHLKGLSDEQMAAATLTSNPVMILAGAGSGKTRSLMGRAAHLVTPVDAGGLGADPSSIMMVTFTNKAAREMRERILPVLEAARDADPKMRKGEPWIGTFHGLSLRILRVESQKAGLGRNFSIFDDSDARALSQEVSDSLGLDAFDADLFFRDLEIAKARLLSHDLLARKALEIHMAQAAGGDMSRNLQSWSRALATFQTPDFTRVYSAYQNALQDQNAVDFSDLLNRTTTLFRDNPDVRNSWRSTFRHFMVDETQDMNRAQIAWLDMLTDGGREMAVPDGALDNENSDASEGLHAINTYRIRRFPRPTVAFVGDDDQSIYAFRGSEVAVMRSLEDRYPGMERRYLSTSYRCQPSILSVVNTLISRNVDRYGKTLVPADPDRHARRVHIEEHVSPNDEIRRIVADANAHITDGRDPKEFAVLVRTRDLVKAVARDLRAHGLPVSEGKASDIRKSAEVRDAMAFAGFICNPDAETLLRRIINKPSRGMGPTSTGRVGANARIKGTSFLDELRSIVNGRIDLPGDAEPYKPAFVRSVRQFGQTVSDLRSSVNKTANAGEAITEILNAVHYLPDMKAQALKSAGVKGDGLEDLPPAQFLAALLRRMSSDPKSAREIAALDGEGLADRAGQSLSEAARRIGNLSILIEQASRFETLTAFMQEAMLEMDQQTAQAGIQVMTVHASKGLEFDVVRLPFWIDGVFPHSRGIEAGATGIEEERRLALVAITRAREDVRISRSWKLFDAPFIRQRDSRPSRFIEDIRRGYASDFHLTSVRSAHDACYRVGPVAKPEPAAPPMEIGMEDRPFAVDPLRENEEIARMLDENEEMFI